MSALRTAAISVRLGMMRLESGNLDARHRAQPLRARSATGWVTKIRGAAASASHRTTPATPSTATCAPSGNARASRRARRAPSGCRARAPARRGARSSRRARRRRRRRAADMAERRTGDARHQNVARRDAAELAFAIHHHGAAGAPADAGGMAVEAGMLEPDFVRHMRGLDAQRPRLQQLEALVVERPFDLDRHADARPSALRISRPSAVAWPASRQGARTSASGTACGAVPCAVHHAQASRWCLRPARSCARKPGG
jgi:hypothetical protein